MTRAAFAWATNNEEAAEQQNSSGTTLPMQLSPVFTAISICTFCFHRAVLSLTFIILYVQFYAFCYSIDSFIHLNWGKIDIKLIIFCY